MPLATTLPSTTLLLRTIRGQTRLPAISHTPNIYASRSPEVAELCAKSATFGVWPTNGSSLSRSNILRNWFFHEVIEAAAQNRLEGYDDGLGKTQLRSVKTFANYDCNKTNVHHYQERLHCAPDLGF